MKLKKVVSLALAGVLAVSMLAGCGTDKKPATDEETTTASGYSAKVAEYIDSDLDYVDFQDSATDATALQSMVDNYGDREIMGSTGTTAFKFDWIGDKSTGVADFTEDAKLDKFVDNSAAYFGSYFNTTVKTVSMNDTVKAGAVYAADGTIQLDKVLKTVAADLADKFDSEASAVLVKQAQDTNKNVVYDYHYTVSVSVVNRDTTTSTMMNVPVTFVAVTITRTGTPHNY